MLLTFYLLFIGLHVVEGCTLENIEPVMRMTAYTGGSVLLPCYCTDLHTTPERFSWKKENTKTRTWEEISSENGQYRNSVQLFNGHSPGNLSLLISHLTEEDGGNYWCAVKDLYKAIKLTVKGCTLENIEQVMSITAYRGGSVLLPCYCTDLHTTPERFSWKKENTETQTWEEISSESGQYRNRVQLVNGHSPGNLSLLISHLTEEDGGVYWCVVKDLYKAIRLTVKEGPPTTTTSTAVVNVHTRLTTQSPQTLDDTDYSIYFFIIIPVLLLLLGLGGVMYWRCRGQRRGQTESREKRRMKREQKTQDEVTYSTVVHSKTPRTTTTVTDIEENAEYATIRVKTGDFKGTSGKVQGPTVGPGLLYRNGISKVCSLNNRVWTKPVVLGMKEGNITMSTPESIKTDV
ncbi:uncharacterized protein LOC118803496 [Colossoma macropomum]|uniref:uncharacterized protein LOC118803496 n=1 Tax=Colossoma macropomum TaxID=42526 RepID=UPI001863E19B|nr:uncharacterized protein LOC118803496 [Colossoma macropomum]